tara:strand:+ start:810 stop:1151 length:342 start_codon:yes stop_codon:yes gene_type:complete
MGKSQREKGKEGEREWAKILRLVGGFSSARRGVQFSGGTDSPDVQCEELSGFHCEVKRVEKLNVYDAMNQAKADASCNQIPYVAHRRNNCRWLVTCEGDDFIKLIQSYIEDHK